MSDDHPKFTCNTCGLSFAEADYQREHMRTDWHRYNLKRRVANLPPIPSDVFAEKMIQQRSAQLDPKPRNANRQITKKDLKRMEKQKKREEALAKAAAAATTEDEDFSDSASVASHAHSVTSAMSSFSLGDPVRSGYHTEEDDFSGSDESDDEGDEVDRALRQKLASMVEIPANVCFMDGKEFDSVEENVEHLERKYGLYVPETKFLVDLKGFVEYLNEKVGLGNCCLYCSYMGRSLEAVRAHMLSKQHVKIPYETADQRAELAEFYDFSSSYADKQNEWEDLSDEDGETDYKVHVDAGDDEDVVDNEVYVDGYELVLGQGKVAGHRTLQRYYKQRFAALPEKESAKAVKMIDMRGPGVSEKEATKMIKQSWKEEKKLHHRMLKRDKNSNNQKHFRDELLQ